MRGQRDHQTLIEALRADMARFGLELGVSEFQKICDQTEPFETPSSSVLLNQTRVADRLAFIVDGLAASRQTWSDGRMTIARFFEAGDICTNVSSAWTGELASDDLIAVTDAHGFFVPLVFFQAEYFHGETFGIYLRYRMMEAHLFAKELACAKTSNETEIVYQFLDTHHRSVLKLAPKKDIARFLGVTPQGFSRFLRRRRTAPRAVASEMPRRSVRPSPVQEP
ncbi:MAG: hypothetical protein AAGI50_12950 [Pseudomonadota bacterium]